MASDILMLESVGDDDTEIVELCSTDGAEPRPPRPLSVIPTDEAEPRPPGYTAEETEAGDDRIDTTGGDDVIVMGESERGSAIAATI